MKTYEITETIERYHTLTIEDDMDIDDIMSKAANYLYRSDNWVEAIDEAMKPRSYDTYSVKECVYGEKIVRLDAEEM